MDQERVPRESAPEQRGDDREFKHAAELDSEFQPDAQLTEGPANRGRVATYAVVIVLILGAVIYGLSTANRQTPNQPSSEITQSNTSPPQAAGTPNPNSQAGSTTGSATNRPTPPQSGPTGADINRSSQPPFAGESR
jgi:hypothetical protein